MPDTGLARQDQSHRILGVGEGVGKHLQLVEGVGVRRVS